MVVMGGDVVDRKVKTAWKCNHPGDLRGIQGARITF